jgi:hypothetical protein
VVFRWNRGASGVQPGRRDGNSAVDAGLVTPSRISRRKRAVRQKRHRGEPIYVRALCVLQQRRSV